MLQNIPSGFSGLEHLATAVILLNQSHQVVYANASAEILFALSAADGSTTSHRA
jgi:two-component system nitrogen regulation sensor histidine kinase GlnL